MKYPLIFFIPILFLTKTCYSDDIEIYNHYSKENQKNIILITGNSPNMFNRVPQEPDLTEKYNPETIYPATDYGFIADALYIYRFNHDIHITLNIANNLKKYQIHPRSLQCSPALFDLKSRGFYSGKLRHYDSSNVVIKWSGPISEKDLLNLKKSNINYLESEDIVDCELGRPYFYQGNSYQYLSDISNEEISPYTNDPNMGYQWESSSVDGHYNYIFLGNYLNYLSSPFSTGSVKTRSDLLIYAVKDVIKSSTDINLSIMRYHHNANGGFVSKPIKSIEEIDPESLEPSSYLSKFSSITETLYEAYLYIKGGRVLFGNGDQYDITESEISDKTNSNHPDAVLNDRYTTPYLEECSTSKVIIFSDAPPIKDDAADQNIHSLISKVILPKGLSKNCHYSESCGEELSFYMNQFDYHPTIDGRQFVTIDTIAGFMKDVNKSSVLLKDIARYGGGSFYAIEDYQSLLNALHASVNSSKKSPFIYSSSNISSNPISNFYTGDDIYFSLYEPSSNPGWRGNIKGYHLNASGNILDINNNPAIEAGHIIDHSVSYWANKINNVDIIDGNSTTLGGIANRYDKPRQVYTSYKNSLVMLKGNPVATTINDLITTDIKQLLTADILGVPDGGNDELNEIRAWILGYHSDLSYRNELEDSLHARPIKFQYSDNTATLFFMTNSGYLHAVDPDKASGREIFSFLPYELLKNPAVYLNPAYDKFGGKRYGLDGNLSIWHDDHNSDGFLNGSEQVYLYFGMRRGGYSYYALNITDRHHPKLLWQINGRYQDKRTNNPPITMGYHRLGQTWSRLVPAEILWQGKPRVVLFAGGGYDKKEDGLDRYGNEKRIKHEVGNTIYMIDALTGEPIWNAFDHSNHPNLTSSFTADIVPIDVDGDGYIDRLYAADIGGRLWRFIFNKSHSQHNNANQFIINKTIMADINNGDINGNRRFFNRPDISLNSHLGTNPITISIGSGYRAHPLTHHVNDFHYIILDNIGDQSPPQILKHENFVTIDNFHPTDEPVVVTKQNNIGWKIPLQNKGEKALSPSITFQGKILFTTYTPKSNINCHSEQGYGRFYQVNLDETKGFNLTVNHSKLETNSIPATPMPLLPNLEASEDHESDPIQPASDQHVRHCTPSTSAILIGLEQQTHSTNRCSRFQWNFWKEIPLSAPND